MAALLIRNLDPLMERELKRLAKESGESLSSVTQKLIRRGMAHSQSRKGFGTEVQEIAARHGYFDLEIERDKSSRPLPDFS
jgi:hypothetical protein